MRKTISFFICLLAVLPLAFIGSARTSSSGLVVDVIVIRDLPHSVRPRVPEKDTLSFDCNVFEAANILVLSSSKMITAEVRIDNFTTGDYIEETIELSPSPSSFELSGVGVYQITITVSSGKEYIGEFEL